MKKLLATMLALVMALTLCATAWADSVFTNGVATVTTADQLQAAFNEVAAGTLAGTDWVINIQNDIALTSWTSVSWALGYDKTVTVNGNGHKITGLTSMLVESAITTKGITFNDLTIEGANIDATAITARGTAAFIGHSESTLDVRFIGCKLIGSTVKGGEWTGGFIGFAAGYNVAGNGPAFENVLFENCTVSGNNNIQGGGSTGALMGHATGNEWTKVVVKDTTVSNNTVTATGAEKAGSLFGTAGCAGATDGGGIEVAATVSGNTVTAAGTSVDTIYGRQGDGTAELKLAGGSYDKQPLKDEDSSWASVDSDVPEATVTAGENTTYNFGADYIEEAAKTADTITVTKGSVNLSDVPGGVTVIVAEGASATVNGIAVAAGGDGTIIYAVTFNSDGGTAVATQNVAAGGTAVAPTAPTKDGYTFIHWCLDGSDETAYDFNTPVNSNITLKAHWTAKTHRHPISITTTETKAESPKTFDAGVAFYGLMAVSSVLGMGVVGKKKF